MASLKEKFSGRVEAIRRRRPLFDHAVRMVQHYGEVKGNLQAGAVTYFAFLSFFPILALAFFAIGWVSKVYPDAQGQLVKAIGEVLPDMVSEKEERGKISLLAIQKSASTVGLIGLLGVLYSGLGWLSGMRDALLVVFEKPPAEQPNFFVGKARDLVSLALIGLVLVLSVAIAGVVNGFSADILDLVGLGKELSPLLSLLTVVVGLGANMLLFFALFRLLAAPATPSRSLWGGALLGAIGFELLKQLSAFLMASTKSQPAFQAFGIALILVVWINYFSRVVMYAAAWAHTSREARAEREEGQAGAETEAWDADPASSRPGSPDRHPVTASAVRATPVEETAATGSAVDKTSGQGRHKAGSERLEPSAAFALGGASALGLVALVRRFLSR